MNRALRYVCMLPSPILVPPYLRLICLPILRGKNPAKRRRCLSSTIFVFRSRKRHNGSPSPRRRFPFALRDDSRAREKIFDRVVKFKKGRKQSGERSVNEERLIGYKSRPHRNETVLIFRSTERRNDAKVFQSILIPTRRNALQKEPSSSEPAKVIVCFEMWQISFNCKERMERWTLDRPCL